MEEKKMSDKVNDRIKLLETVKEKAERRLHDIETNKKTVIINKLTELDNAISKMSERKTIFGNQTMKEHLIEQRQKIARAPESYIQQEKQRLNAKKVQIESEIEQIKKFKDAYFQDYSKEAIQQFIISINKSIESKNYFAALFIALAIPDICGGLEDRNAKNRERYVNWFNKYIGINYRYINGNAIWKLRCSCIHSGTHLDNKVNDALSGAELLLVTYEESPFHDSYIRLTPSESYVFLRIDVFCEDICLSINKWLEDVSNNQEIQKRIEEMLFIEKGFKAKEMIMGGVNFKWNRHVVKQMFSDVPAEKGFKLLWVN